MHRNDMHIAEAKTTTKQSALDSPVDRQAAGAWCNYHALLQKLYEEDASAFKILRMTKESFEELKELVSPFLKRKDTNMREAISSTERLALTLLNYFTTCLLNINVGFSLFN